MSTLDIDNTLSYITTRSQRAAFIKAKCRWVQIEDPREPVDWLVAIHPEEVKAYVWADRTGEEAYENTRIIAYNIDYLLSQSTVNTAVQTALHQLGFREREAF